MQCCNCHKILSINATLFTHLFDLNCYNHLENRIIFDTNKGIIIAYKFYIGVNNIKYFIKSNRFERILHANSNKTILSTEINGYYVTKLIAINNYIELPID